MRKIPDCQKTDCNQVKNHEHKECYSPMMNQLFGRHAFRFLGFWTLMTSLMLSGMETTQVIEYLYPIPGSKNLSPQTTIALRLQNGEALSGIQFHVMENNQKQISGRIKRSAYRNTWLFVPDQPFIPGSRIDVVVTSADLNTPMAFFFMISPLSQPEKNQIRSRFFEYDTENIFRKEAVPTVGQVQTIHGVTVPSDFPLIDVLEDTEESDQGLLFFGFRQKYIIIMENDGTPFFYRKSNDFLMDFKVQPNGMLSKNIDDRSKHIYAFELLNSHYEPVDTFFAQHGYSTDHHDFHLLENGHALFICNDYQRVDMRGLVEGGRENVNVMGHIVQELDTDKNVVFEWRSWDHLNIEDAVHEQLTGFSIDFSHINSVAVDYDGHLVISSRNQSACIKINRQTGDIIWILGGVRNEFTFINDADQNSYQHMFRPVPGKPDHYTLFDNGNYHPVHYSRAVEYQLNPEQRTAEKVWEFRHHPDLSAAWLGSVQRLPNGNTLIGWSGHVYPFATEVDGEGNIVYEAEGTQDLAVYRSYRFEWDGRARAPELLLESAGDRVILIFNHFGEKDVQSYNIYSGFDRDRMTLLAATEKTRYDIENVENQKKYFFKVSSVSESGQESPFSETREIFVEYYDPGQNMLKNGQFNSGVQHWELTTTGDAAMSVEFTQGFYHFVIQHGGLDSRDIQLKQTGIPVYHGKKYRLEFDAYAATPRAIEFHVQKAASPYTNYGRIGPTYIRTQTEHYSYDFVMQESTDLSADVVVQCGGEEADVYIDNVSLSIIDQVSSVAAHSALSDKERDITIFPNPFNQSTTINFYVQERGSVHLRIVDLLGREVTGIHRTVTEPGTAAFTWNGTDQAGRTVASGIYYLVIENGNLYGLRKVVLLK
jgi:hypothetical protein